MRSSSCHPKSIAGYTWQGAERDRLAMPGSEGSADVIAHMDWRGHATIVWLSHANLNQGGPGGVIEYICMYVCMYVLCV